MKIKIEVKASVNDATILEHEIKIEDGSKDMMIATSDTAINVCTEELKKALDKAIAGT